jgi:hypothetical protein
MKQLIKGHIASSVKILEVEHLAEAGGHTVLFTLAYHCDLQPIEFVWALVKGNVGHQYSNQTTLDMVYERLMHEFNQLEDRGHHSINGMIEKCVALALQFHGEMDAEDDSDDSDRDDSSVDTQADPPDPPAAAGINRGDPGGDSFSEEGVLDPLPWCNVSGGGNKMVKIKQK